MLPIFHAGLNNPEETITQIKNILLMSVYIHEKANIPYRDRLTD